VAIRILYPGVPAGSYERDSKQEPKSTTDYKTRIALLWLCSPRVMVAINKIALARAGGTPAVRGRRS